MPRCPVSWPTTDFDPQRISKICNIKTSGNHKIINKLFLSKNDLGYNFIAISNIYICKQRV
jgi:hypothetical protein